MKRTLIIAVALASWPLLAEDVITLKSGTKLRGDVLEYADGVVKIRDVKGKVRQGKISAIDRIAFDTGSQAAPKRREAPKPAPRARKKERVITTFTGSGAKNTRPFTTNGPWEIQWDAKGTIFQLFLLASDGTPIGVPGNQQGAGKGSSYQPQPGKYLLQVNAMGKWTIKIVEVPDDTEPQHGAAKTPLAKTKGAANPSSAVSFLTIRKNMAEMTDLQFKRYAAGLEGKTVSWKGWVEEVKERFLGGYSCWVDMDSPAVSMSVQDVTFDVPESVALKLKKDQQLRFTGKIEDVMSLLGSCQVNLAKGTTVQF